MRRFLVLFRKEMTENVRRRRLVILVLVFVFFAILSPMSAKYMPELVKWILSTQSGTGFPVDLPAPVPADSFVQFLKNLTQMGVLLAMLLLMGAVTEEKRKGSVVLLLTKGVPRPTFLLAKLASSVATVVGAYALSCIVFLYYQWLSFGQAPDADALTVLSVFMAYLVLMSSVTLLAGTLAKSTAMAAAGALGGYFLLSMLSLLPVVKDYAPSALVDQSLSLLAGKASSVDLVWPLVVTLALAAVLAAIAVLAFRRQEL